MDERRTGWMIIFICILALFVLFAVRGCADEIDDIIPFVIQVESSSNPNAVSSAGCIGLMQINPRGALAEWNAQPVIKYQFLILDRFGNEERRTPRIPPIYSVSDLFDPKTNIKIGEWYLRRLKNHYLKENYTLKRLLFAWNGGITKLRRFNYDCSKMPSESRRFYEKVIKRYNRARENE